MFDLKKSNKEKASKETESTTPTEWIRCQIFNTLFRKVHQNGIYEHVEP